MKKTTKVFGFLAAMIMAFGIWSSANCNISKRVLPSDNNSSKSGNTYSLCFDDDNYIPFAT